MASAHPVLVRDGGGTTISAISVRDGTMASATASSSAAGPRPLPSSTAAGPRPAPPPRPRPQRDHDLRQKQRMSINRRKIRSVRKRTRRKLETETNRRQLLTFRSHGRPMILPVATPAVAAAVFASSVRNDLRPAQCAQLRRNSPRLPAGQMDSVSATTSSNGTFKEEQAKKVARS